MNFTLRAIDPKSKWSPLVSLEALHRVLPLTLIHQVLKDLEIVTRRERKLTLPLTALWIVALSLFADQAMEDVMETMMEGAALLHPNAPTLPPGAPALVYRRRQLGVRPMATLFHRICQPMASEETPGAFRFGLRLMAIDGSVETLANTPANVARFGKHTTDRGPVAYPQALGVYLCECGTHAVVDAGLWPCHASEREGARRLLRSVEPGMLVLWDRGFHSFTLLRDARHRGAHVLGRLPAGAHPRRIRKLPDGSCLVWISSWEPDRQKGEGLIVRLLEYTLTDPALPGYGESHRLVTTLLDPADAPARELAETYHDRWEIEGVFDEKDTHQRRPGVPLRSQSPVGVIQEWYGLLIAHYAVRFLLQEAAQRTGTAPTRLSFIHALRMLRITLVGFQLADPVLLPALYERLLEKIAQRPLSERRCRSNPRVVKRQQSKFPVKRPEHRQLSPPLYRSFQEAILLI